jgi:hypothetical protein
MPKSIPVGTTPEHVLRALAELDAGAEHPFGPATGYELVHAGKRYAPKAVIGLAFRHATGSLLRPDEFSGGEAPGQANFVLRKLGFAVVRKGEPVEAEEPKPQPDWSDYEVRLVVADYFSMLETELLGLPLNKAEHRRALVPQLAGRSEPAVEFKHANISAVLAGQGLPYINGYKPRGNFQALLAQEIDSFLDACPDFLERIASATVLNQDAVPTAAPLETESVIEDPPEVMTLPEPTAKPWRSRRGRRIDFVERDARNRELGRLGEGFVIALERQRLRSAGRDDLAGRVEQVSETVGDGLGFDVLSFDDIDDAERLIEVKTTALGKCHPFIVTATEVRCSEDVPDRFQLFRVFEFGRGPRAYVLTGSLRANCRLAPVAFRAAV